MNQPPENFVIVVESRLLTFAQECFAAAGAPPEHAKILSRLLVNSDLRGVRSHGTRQVDGYCRAFEEGILNPDPQVRVISDRGA
ncbi:MAG: Ldh family oxidoreductase, partial [Gemmatimonadetes bacterium]|nr:Ldh family oxidoreductase [Gemmatimonadota bacterium]